jgi:hypothetical protein
VASYNTAAAFKPFDDEALWGVGGALNRPFALFGFGASQVLGLGVEVGQLWADQDSAFKWEDFYSNFLGGAAGAVGLPVIPSQCLK